VANDNQIGRMLLTFEGFTPNAIMEDTIDLAGGSLADGRLGSQASSQLCRITRRRRTLASSSARLRTSNRRYNMVTY